MTWADELSRYLDAGSQAPMLVRGIELALSVDQELDARVELSVDLGTGTHHPLVVMCAAVQDWVLRDSYALDVAVLTDHPALVALTTETGQLSVASAPNEPTRVADALYRSHAEVFGPSRPIEDVLNSSGLLTLPELLAGGHGIVSSGPVDVLEVHQALLAKHSIESRIVNRAPAKCEGPLLVFAFGGSHIAARAVEASGGALEALGRLVGEN